MKINLIDREDLTQEQRLNKDTWKLFRPLYQKTFYINDISITVPNSIYKAEEVDGICLVLFTSDSEQMSKIKGYDRGRNIWAFNEKGEKLWEIEDAGKSIARQKISNGLPREKFYENGELKVDYRDTYAGFNVGKQQYAGKVFITTSCNFTAELDIKTGRAFDWIQGK